MKIDLKAFKGNGSLLFEEEINPEEIDIDIGVMSFSETLLLKVEVWKDGNDLTVQGRVEGPCDLTCSLCLEEFNNLFEKDFTLHYDIKGLDSVTIDPDVRDEIILEHPIRILCSPDCRGLCSFCGANLNKEKCDCKGEI